MNSLIWLQATTMQGTPVGSLDSSWEQGWVEPKEPWAYRAELELIHPEVSACPVKTKSIDERDQGSPGCQGLIGDFKYLILGNPVSLLSFPWFEQTQDTKTIWFLQLLYTIISQGLIILFAPVLVVFLI